MLGFKERITKIVSKKHTSDPRKKRKMEKVEDTVKIIIKIQAERKIKNIVGLFIAKNTWVTCSKIRSK